MYCLFDNSYFAVPKSNRRNLNIKIEQKYPKQRFYPHSMPVETSVTSTGAILVLEAIVETETKNGGS